MKKLRKKTYGKLLEMNYNSLSKWSHFSSYENATSTTNDYKYGQTENNIIGLCQVATELHDNLKANKYP